MKLRNDRPGVADEDGPGFKQAFWGSVVIVITGLTFCYWPTIWEFIQEVLH